MRSIRTYSFVAVVLAAAAPASAQRVLWDVSHGVYQQYTPRDRYFGLFRQLEADGYTVDTTDHGFLVDEPGAYDVLIVAGVTSAQSAYSPAEITQIQDFVRAGGGLLLMADNPTAPNAGIVPVAQSFGFGVGLSHVVPADLYSSNLADHPLFGGVGTIHMLAAGEISGGMAVAWQGKPIVSVATPGAGQFFH